MSVSNQKIIDLHATEWSEVSPPTIGEALSNKSLTSRLLRHAIIASMSATLGFIAYGLDQDMDLDFDYEHPELSTTANVAPEELARIERSENIPGYRISVAHNVTTNGRTPIDDDSLAFLDVRKK